MKRIVLTVLTTLAMAVSSSLAAVKPLAAVRINNLENALTDAERLATALEAKIPVRMAMMPLGSMMMSPTMTGVDTTKPITIYAGMDDAMPGGMPMTAVRFHVNGDGTEYLESLDQQLPGRVKQSDAIFKYPLGGPGSEGGPAFYVVLKNGQVLAGNSLETMKALGNGVSVADIKTLDEMGGTLSISFNAATLRAILNEELAKQSKRMEDLGQDAGDHPDYPGMKVDPKAIMDSYQKMLDQFLGQLDGLVLNLTLSDAVTLRFFTRASPGSVFQQIIDDLQVPPAVVAGMDMPGAIMGGYGTMSGMDRVMDAYADWIATIYKAMGPPFSEQADQYRELTLAMQGVYTGGYNFFLLPAKSGDSPFQMGGIYEISDKAKAADSIRKMMALQSAQAATLKGESNAVPVEPIVSDYRGMEVTTFQYDFGINPASADDMPPSLMGMLSGLDYHVAFKDNLMLYAAGAKENLDPVIDQLEQAGSAQSMAVGFEDLNTDLYGYMYLNAGGIFGMVSQLMQAAGNNGAPPVGDINASLRAASVKEFGGLSLLIRLTESDVKNFGALFKRLAPKRGMPPPPSDDMPEELMAPELE